MSMVLIFGVFCIACLVHELGHIIFAKHFGIYEGTVILRLANIIEGRKIPRLEGRIGRIPLGFCVKTNLEEEDIIRRGGLVLSGIFAGLWVVMLASPHHNTGLYHRLLVRSDHGCPDLMARMDEGIRYEND